MAEQSFASRFYGLAERVPVTGLLTPVGKSEPYKALREQELVCYHQLVRVFHMHSADLSRQQLRILEDLRTMFSISDDRGRAEVAMAQADPFLQSLRDSGVASNRTLHSDGLDDLTSQRIASVLAAKRVPLSEGGAGTVDGAVVGLDQHSEDDRREEYALLDASSMAARHGGGLAGARPGASSTAPPAQQHQQRRGATGGSNSSKAAGAPPAAAISNNPVVIALANSAAELSLVYARASASARAGLKQELQAKLANAEALLATIGEAPTDAAGRATTPRSVY
jgi:hypothetical protein